MALAAINSKGRRTVMKSALWSATAAALASSVAAAYADTPPAESDAVNTRVELRASELIGARVRSTHGENVGEVRDLVLTPQGHVAAAVLSVGGLFGIGGKLVEVPYDDLRPAAENEVVFVAQSRAELAAAPAYSANEAGTDRGAAPAAVSAPVVTPPPVQQPDAASRAAAEAEAARSFANEDPRVAQGIAENKEAYDDKTSDTAQPQ
jgi:sporulation protein YlmC with PRC-barrel domain